MRSLRTWRITLAALAMLVLQAHAWVHSDHAVASADQVCVACSLAEHGGTLNSAHLVPLLFPNGDQSPRGLVPSGIISTPRLAPRVRGPPAPYSI